MRAGQLSVVDMDLVSLHCLLHLNKGIYTGNGVCVCYVCVGGEGGGVKIMIMFMLVNQTSLT